MNNRDTKICELFKSCHTLQEIADIVNLSHEGVRQVLISQGIKPSEGGAALRGKIKKSLYQAKQRERCWFFYKCSIEEKNEIIDRYVQYARRSYMRQIQNSLQREISWDISCTDWMDLWIASGHWEERGRDKYVMARHGDTGPYCTHNVAIITAAQNMKDAYINNRIIPPLAASGYRGIIEVDDKWIARVYHNGKSIYLGRYDTAIAAARAYDDKKVELLGQETI